MIRERIAEPSCKHIRRDLAPARFANACRGFHPGRGTVSLLVLLVVMALPIVTFAGDPTGAGTGNAGTITAAKPGEPTIQEVADAVGHTIVSANFIWTLVAGFLVMFMQAGFALAETGFTRAKNAAHTMAMNFMVYGLGMTGFWICGYALMMGGVNAPSGFGGVASLGGLANMTSEFTVSIAGHTLGIFGTKGIFLRGDSYDVGVFALFLFAMVFMDTAATIPTGAMAERWKWSSFVVFAFFMSMFVYPIFGNWVWGGGWLAQLGREFHLGHGHVDFAGSSVVHMVGGVAALAGAMVLGPRIGKYTKDGKVHAMPGHHMPMALVGVFILAFGWFGFNAGSTMSGTDLRISVVATNTMLASGVHGVNGAWGVISVGLFADGSYGGGWNGVEGTVRGLFYGGGWSQLLAEIVGTVACFIFVFVSFYVFFKIVGVLIGNRVSAEVEIEGLDLAEVGALGYPEFYRPSPYSGTQEIAYAETDTVEEVAALRSQESLA